MASAARAGAMLLLFLSVGCANRVQDQPDTQRAVGEFWNLTVGHPARDPVGMYECVLTLPSDQLVNEHLGFSVILIDRAGQELGVIPQYMGSVFGGQRLIECRLGKQLIKNSYVLFQVDPNTPSARFVKATLGEGRMMRRVGGKVVYEHID